MNASTQNMARLARIRTVLERRFKPLSIDLVDESHQHVGHAGARGGGGHFRLQIIAEEFAPLTTLKRHRLIYAALGELMQREIHALSIEALAPAETSQRLKTIVETIENSSSQRIP